MDYQQVGGYLWPANDQHCYPAVVGSLEDIPRAVNRCLKRDVVIQAGGNCGVWARELSSRFQTVYTFEPDPYNFHCLCANTNERVIKFNAALGCERGLIRTALAEHEENNIGAYHVETGGVVPTMFIDDLALESCDLIYLDIEGSEWQALKGGEATIDRYMPVIALELKNLGRRYGYADEEVIDWLGIRGYRQVESFSNDKLFTCSR